MTGDGVVVPESELGIEIRHVDGTTMNALERGTLLQWLKEGPAAGEDVCRVLTNARCLSEGVDVPALDAVMFLTPRGSQVDIVQSVGRVMRKSPGKDLGYIILPVVIPSGIAPEEALRDNERFKVVWQVLQALRAHDDRFNAMVNKIDLNTRRPDRIVVIDGGRGGAEDRTTDPAQLTLPFGIEQWRDSIYAKIVQRVGERRYWQTWAGDVSTIAQQHIVRITGLLADDDSVAALEFAVFLEGLRGNLNAGISKDDAIEMLAQHLITRPVFDALFGGYDFAATNPVAQTMERMLAVLDEHSLDTENSSLERFYDSVRMRVQGVNNAEGRQKIIVELYDKFFATAFKKTVDKLGIVYTPVEIVDFILNSADQVLREHFGQGLTDEGVHILDGFTGTGTFMVRLLQSGLIKPHDLARKYANELHANEILLLAYYIAAVNIETTYQDLVSGGLDEKAAYEPFPGLVLTDTFQSYEEGDHDDLAVFPQNNERIIRQRSLPITVILGNPPYSSGQDSANDNNANEKYPHLDAAIRDTYAARSTATNKNSLYDSYIRAIKWATLRIKDRGVIAFVTNGGFLDSNTADGMRKTLGEEFSAIHIYNLRGNRRNAGAEGRPIFEAFAKGSGGSIAGIAVIVLVMDPACVEACEIKYAQVGDFTTANEKVNEVVHARSVHGLETVRLTPNRHGDWINQRRDDFGAFLPIGDKEEPDRGLFTLFSRGVASSRDAWVYNSSIDVVEANVRNMIESYEADRLAAHGNPAHQTTQDPSRISWSRGLRADLGRNKSQALIRSALTTGAYRPFTRQHVYFDRAMNDMVYRLPSLFPTSTHTNFGFVITGVSSHAPFSFIMVDRVPDLHTLDTGQFFPRWRYEPIAENESTLFARESTGDVVDGYRRIDNITDTALARFRTAYGDSITKDDTFSYVYGILHSPDYRETYSADLKKMLPRIPLVEDAQPFIGAGRSLSEIHLGYESVTPYPLGGLDVEAPAGPAAYDFFRVEKMRFGKPTNEQKTAGERNDRTTIVYNDRITLRGIPEAAYRYMLGSRSAIEWIIDRYQVKTDKPSGIVNDPNDWSREVEDPRYIIDLLARIVTVSLETMQIVDDLPPLAIRADQNPTAG